MVKFLLLLRLNIFSDYCGGGGLNAGGRPGAGRGLNAGARPGAGRGLNARAGPYPGGGSNGGGGSGGEAHPTQWVTTKTNKGTNKQTGKSFRIITTPFRLVVLLAIPN